MKNVKAYRFFKISLLFIFLISICLLVASCAHKHSYESEITLAPTCTSKGNMHYQCSCGDSFDEVIDFAEHDLENCSDDLYHWKSCRNCDYSTTKVTHSFVTVAEANSQPSTCAEHGFETRACSCGKEQIFQLPLLQHSWGSYIIEDGTHYQKCENCCATTDKVTHTFNTVVPSKSQPSTCTEHGFETRACVCGEEQRTDNLPLADHKWGKYIVEADVHFQKCIDCKAETDKTSHNYATVIAEESQPSTCKEHGIETRACVCGEKHLYENLPLASHKWGRYTIDGDNHYQKCSVCNQQSESVAHNYTEIIAREASSCTKHGIETRACVCGAEQNVELPLISHSYTRYATDKDGTSGEHWRVCAACGVKLEGSNELHVTQGQETYHEGSCIEHPYWETTCSVCNAKVKYEEDGYGAHSPVYFADKSATDYTDGYKAHWKCSLCNRMFSGHGCQDDNELFESEVIIPRRIKVLSSYDELLQAAETIDFTDATQRNQIYQLTIAADTYDVDNYSGMSYAMFGPQANVELYLNADISKIDSANSNIVVKFNIGSFSSSDDEISLINGAVVDITYVNAATKTYSLRIKADGAYGNDYIKVVSSDDEELYCLYPSVSSEFYWYGAFEKNQTIKLVCQAYGGKKLKTLAINGKSYSLTDGKTAEITVTEDIYAEFVFDEAFVNTRVTLETINTSEWNAPIQAVDPYLSYEYRGGTNDDGRLYKDSTTRFYVENANITSIIIEYEADENYLKAAAKNKINVSTSQDSYRYPCEQTLNGTTVTLVFEASDNYHYIEYVANNSQARIVSITIEYTTNNTFAK